MISLGKLEGSSDRNRQHFLSEVQGAKNAMLPLLYASVAAGIEVNLIGVPTQIIDFKANYEVLTSIGASITISGNRLAITSDDLNFSRLSWQAVRATRYSALLLAVAASRRAAVSMPIPGGCDIQRPLDIHLDFFRALNSTACESGAGIEYRSSAGIERKRHRLRFPSVGATINALIALASSNSNFTLENIAIEPEVIQIIEFLRAAGCELEFTSIRSIKISPRSLKGPLIWPVMTDRIEGITKAVAAIIARKRLTLKGIGVRYIASILAIFDQMGVEFTLNSAHDELTIYGDRLSRLNPVRIETGVHPAFPTDLQPIFAAALVGAHGHSIIRENVIPGRFQYVDHWRSLGIDVKVIDDDLHINSDGVPPNLRDNFNFDATDIRGGMASLLLAMSLAKEGVKISNERQILRGYEDLSFYYEVFGFGVSTELCSKSA